MAKKEIKLQGFFLCLCGRKLHYHDLPIDWGWLEFSCDSCGGISTLMTRDRIEKELKYNK